jgi:GntR family transcriptional regulator
MSYQARVSATRSRADVARRIRDTLRDEILRARYPHGLLPSESALMVRYGASRTAIRMALDLLRAEGLVRRLQGVGTVATDHEQVAFALDPPRSVVRSFEGQSHLVDYIPVSLFATTASPGIAERLDLRSTDRVVFIERLTLMDSVPMSLVSSWIPMNYAAPLFDGDIDVEHKGIFDILEQDLGMELGDSDYSIEATAADAAVATLLGVPSGSPILLRSTLNHLADGRPLSFGYTRGRPDRVRYECRGVRSSRPSAVSADAELHRRAS